MNTCKTIADVLPVQDHYYLLYNGEKYARHGTPDATGLLVFANLERAEQFYMTVGKTLDFTPVKVAAEDFLQLAIDIGAFCIAEGLQVSVCTLRDNKHD